MHINQSTLQCIFEMSGEEDKQGKTPPNWITYSVNTEQIYTELSRSTYKNETKNHIYKQDITHNDKAFGMKYRPIIWKKIAAGL